MKAVLVTTEYRGVFFGYIPEESIGAEELFVFKARNCVLWSEDVKGFLGLAANGPSENCRIGPAAGIYLHKITSISEVSDAAVLKWEAAPWKE
jgi:hypothetical protein